MAPITKRHCNGIGQERDHALGFARRELRSEPPVEHKEHPIFPLGISLHKRDSPTVYNHIVVLEWPRKGDRHAWHVGTLLLIHAVIFDASH